MEISITWNDKLVYDREIKFITAKNITIILLLAVATTGATFGIFNIIKTYSLLNARVIEVCDILYEFAKEFMTLV